jgi:hypothetical protein
MDLARKFFAVESPVVYPDEVSVLIAGAGMSTPIQLLILAESEVVGGFAKRMWRQNLLHF